MYTAQDRGKKVDLMRLHQVGFFCLCSRTFLQKLLSVFGWCDAVLLFEIPDELSGIGIAYGFTDIIQFQVRSLQKLLRPVQLKGTHDGGE